MQDSNLQPLDPKSNAMYGQREGKCVGYLYSASGRKPGRWHEALLAPPAGRRASGRASSPAMEKFRSTADPSTGIHPFIPARDPTGLLRRVVCLVVLFPVRVCFLLLGVSVTFCVAGFGALVAAVSGVLARPFFRVGHAVGLRAVLLGLGVWRYSSPALERPRSRVSVQGAHPTHGDVVFCNHASYMDPIYLACAYSPTFVLVNEAGVCVRVTLWQATQQALSGALVAPQERRDDVPTLAELAKSCEQRRAGPVVVFAEGTTTNGSGVLSFASQGMQVRDVATFALGISYSPSRAETHTVGSGLKHALGRMTAVGSEIRGRAAGVPPDGDPQPSVASLAGVPPLRLTAEARARYESHLLETSKGY
jgi:Acyltransferase